MVWLEHNALFLPKGLEKVVCFFFLSFGWSFKFNSVDTPFNRPNTFQLIININQFLMVLGIPSVLNYTTP